MSKSQLALLVALFVSIIIVSYQTYESNKKWLNNYSMEISRLQKSLNLCQEGLIKKIDKIDICKMDDYDVAYACYMIGGHSIKEINPGKHKGKKK